MARVRSGDGVSLTRKMRSARVLLDCGLAEAVLVGALFLVPLATAPWLVDPYVSAKWHLLAPLAGAWLVVESSPPTTAAALGPPHPMAKRDKRDKRVPGTDSAPSA